MGPARTLGGLLCLVLVQLSSCQNPFIPITDTCSLQTCAEPSKFLYKPGTAYRFSYKANTASAVLGVSKKSTTLTLKCDVILHILAPCEHAITIENVKLHTVAVDQGSLKEKDIESDGFSSPLQDFQLRFGFHDGVVDSVCPDPSDTTWSVNVKKGIVSALQNSMDRLDLDYSEVERDVTGDCTVKYAVEGASLEGLAITKVRDLNTCVGRFAHTSHIQGVGYSIKSPVQNIPLVSSSSSCRQTVRTNRLTSVVCEERHLLQPFSHEESGAVTVTAQNLTLLGEESAGATQDIVSKRETLLFNHLPAKSASHTREKSLAEAEALVRNLCKDDSEVRVDSTRQFSELIDDLRGMSHTEINSLYELSPRICRHGRQLIEDALPVVSTAGSLKLMSELIVSEQVSSRVANTWLMALNFIPSVDQAMLESAGLLLEVERSDVVTRARLAVGAVLHQYCRQHASCQTDHVALEIVERLARPLGSDCSATGQEDERKVLLTLRAIGNAGLSPPNVVYTLNECFFSRSNPARIKVAAIEAFRRFSCGVRRDEMRSVFRDLAEDSEVRVAAYLGLMRCPSHEEIGLIRTALETEQINQVGSFMWTHLMNLQETASPYQLEVQGLLADVHLQKKFSTDVRKFSRNFEISGFNSEYHMGASLDSNLVYSSKSYIPRSINSNLTLQLFGESVNLLEVGARVEGLEALVEKVLAPGGVLNDAAPGSLIRNKRQAERQKLEKIKSDFAAADRFGEPLGFLHMKVFGHEVDNVDLRASDAGKISAWLAKNGAAEWINSLSSTEGLDISRSVKFLEGTYIVPTGVGLPLNLTASAVAAVNVQMSGNAQLERLLRNRELDIAFMLRPSGAVTCDMTMLVDSMAVQLGVGMKATVHSSTQVDASLKMEGFKLMDAKLNMPKDRMDLYNFESSLQFIHQDKQTTLTSEITMEGDRHEQVSLNSCSGGEKIKGWRTCAHLMYVNASRNTMSPHFPLTGPTKIGLYVEKTDKTMEGYNLKWKVSENQFDHNLEVLFDTPKSTINRRVQLKLKRSKKHGRIGFRLTYPGDELTGKGETAWEPNRKKLMIVMSRRGVEVLALTAQLTTEDGSFGRTYRPTFVLNFLQNPYANLQGFIRLSQRRGEMSRIISLSFSSPFVVLNLNSNATQTEELYKSDIRLKHSIQGAPEREISLLLEARDGEDGDGGRVGHWMMAIDWDFSSDVRIAWAARWDSKNSRVGTMNKVQTAMLPEHFDKKPTFSVGYAFDFMSTEDSSKVRGSVFLLYPSAHLDLKLSAEHDNIYRGLRNKIILRYAPGREVRSLLNVTGLPLWRTGKLEASWRLELPGYPHPILLSGTVRQMPRETPLAPNVYKFVLNGGWLNGGSASASGQYQFQMSQGYQLAAHSASFSLVVDERPLMDGNFRLEISAAQIDVELKVVHNGNEYGVEAQYGVASVESDLQRSLRLGITYPGSGYSITGTLRLGQTFRTTLELSLDNRRDIHVVVGGSHSASLLEWLVDVKWDANRDPTQRLSLDFRAEQPTPATRNVTVLIVYPVNTIQFTMDRTMTGSLRHLQYNNHMVVAFGAPEPIEMTITASTELEQPTKLVTVFVTGSSPFQNWRTNSLKLSHRRSPGNVRSRLDVSAGGERLNAMLDGTYNLPWSLEVTSRVTSSLERWSRLEAVLRHSSDPRSVSSSLALEAPGNRITVDLGLNDRSDPMYWRYTGELNITTPFQGMHDARYTLKGLYGSGKIAISGESKVENIGHSLLLKGQNGGYYERLEGSLSLDQLHPLQNILTANLLVDPTSRGRAFKTSVTWPDSRVSLEGDMHFDHWQDFGVGLQFLSPLESLKDAGLMIRHKRTETYRIQSEARVAWLLDNPLALSVDADLRSLTDMHLRTELSLPLARWNRVALGLRNRINVETRSLTAGLEGALAKYKMALTADGSLGADATDKRFGTVTVTLPAGPVQQVTLAASVLPSRANFYELFLSPVWKMRDGQMQQVRLTSVVDVAGRLQAQVRLLTPWTEMLFLEMQHETALDQSLRTRLVGSMGRSTVQLRSQLIKLIEEHGYKFLMTMTSNVPEVPTFESTSTLFFSPETRLTITVTTPREYFLTVGGDFQSRDRIMADAELRTPQDRASANLVVAGDPQERQVNVVIILPGYGREIRARGTVKPQDLRLTISTPFDGFRSAAVRLSAGVGSGRFDPVFRLTWDRYKLELTGTAVTQGRGMPRQVTGTLTANLPIGPRVTGNFRLVARPGRDQTTYDLTVTSSVDGSTYQLQGEILPGPLKYGLIIETTSGDGSAQISGTFVVSVNAVPGVVGLQLLLSTPHEALRDVSFNAEHRLNAEGRHMTVKLRHPQLSMEAGSRVLLASWRHFHISADGRITLGRMVMQRAVRVYHGPSSTGPGSELGLGWHLTEPDPGSPLGRWGRYHALLEYSLSPAGLDGQLLVGADVWSDRTAPTDLRAGLDLDWQQRGAMARGVLTVHVLQAVYTLDVAYSGLSPYTGSVRMVRRGGGSNELEVTGQGSLNFDRVTSRWQGALNLTLPMDGYKAVYSTVEVKPPSQGAGDLSVTVEIDPKSSFYEHGSHHVELSFNRDSAPLNADFSYIHMDLDDDRELRKATGDLTTTYTRDEMGLDLKGELNDGSYRLKASQTNQQQGKAGKMEITSTFPALEDFTAEYDFKAGRGPGEPVVSTTFRSVYNQNQLLDGSYTMTRSPGSQRHTLGLDNPLHPFDADLTYAGSLTQRRVDVTVTSRNDSSTISGWAEAAYTGTGRALSASVDTPWRSLAVRHSVDLTGAVYTRAARVTLSPEAFIGYQLTATGGTDVPDEDGGSVRLQLDLPARSLAGSVLGARLHAPSGAFRSARSELQFQWDAERQPERQVGSTIQITNLSTRMNRHYNLTVSVDLAGKPATLKTSIQRSRSAPLQLDAAFLYSADPDSHMTMSYGVVDQSRGSKRVLKSTLFVNHPVSKLSVTGKGQLEVARDLLKLSGAYTYLDIEDRDLKTTVELDVDRKQKEFKGQITLPSVIYELKSSTGLKEYRINGAAIPTEFGSAQTLLMTLDRSKPLAKLEILYDPEQAKRLYIAGGLTNNRTARLEAYRQAGQYRVDDVVLFLRLNHSHLLTSQARWRTELGHELAEFGRTWTADMWETVQDSTATEWDVKTGAIQSSLEEMFGEEIDMMVEDFTSERTGTVKGDYEDIRFALSESYENNEFYMKTVLSYIYGDDDSLVKSILNQLESWTERMREDLGIINETVYEKLNEAIEYLRSLVTSSREGERTVADTLKEVIVEVAEAYNQWAKGVWARVRLRLHQVYSTVTGYVRHRLMALYQLYQPQLLTLHHNFEQYVVKSVRDAAKWFYGEFTQSELYSFIKWLEVTVDQLYRDISERDVVTNVFDYTKKVFRWIYTKFGLEDVFGRPGLRLKEIWDNPPSALARVKNMLSLAYDKVTWLVDYLGVADFVQRMVTKIYQDGDKFWTQTAIEGAQRYFEGKAIMEMKPERGCISYIQILPMPWYGLNQEPVWEELPELQRIRYLQSFNEGSDRGIYDIFYEYWPGSNPMDWMPPFKGHAVLSGSSTFLTFDGRLYSFKADCSYLLAADLLNDRFSVELTIRRRSPVLKTITVSAGNHSIQLGGVNGFRLSADGRPAEAPLQAGDLRAVRSGDVVTVTLPNWLTLRCNQRSDVCGFEISRWMYGRTGGLLGTLDNEPYTDLQTPDHLPATGALFAAGWAVRTCRRPAEVTELREPKQDTVSARFGVPRSDGFCRGLLESASSEYRACHGLVDPAPFLAACERHSDQQRCVAVRAYVEACHQRGWPLKLPNKCAQCTINKQTVFEGKTVRVQHDTPATEVVFIVEAKQCNADLKERRSMGRLVLSLDETLKTEGFAPTQYAVMVFGGDGVQNEPRILTVGGNIFSPARKIIKAFDRIKPGSGNRDVFGALRRAVLLPFSPGVSRTFVLLPCSACEAAGMSVDYTTLANAFAEQQVTLHVILDGDLKVSKKQNRLLGIDRNKAYTMKDSKRFAGDTGLKKHVKSPKAELRLCEPLATKQTNGSIFASSKLEPSPKTGRVRTRPLKRYLQVLGQRIALTARPQRCQMCECATDVEGTARPVCMSCSSSLLLPSDPEDDIFFEDGF